ncbi:hypothetical protein ACLB2K_034899 [Fragaria x ananassa]
MHSTCRPKIIFATPQYPPLLPPHTHFSNPTITQNAAFHHITDYRIPPTMNLWTDDNASLMEAFMSNSDLTSFWAAQLAAHPFHQPQSLASTTNYPRPSAQAPAPVSAPFNQETLMQRLQALIEGAKESWTYTIFWQSSYDMSGASVLSWGEGFYKDERPDRLAASSCERVRQGQVFGLQTMVCVPTVNDVVELGSIELIFQSSNLMNKIRVLFDFNNLEVGSWPISGAADQTESDPSSFWINDNPSSTIEVVKESVSIAPTTSGPSTSNHHISKNLIPFDNNHPSSSGLTNNPSAVLPISHHQ